MGQIENTIAVYEKLKGKKYKITIENGDEVVFSFGTEHYHHLAGYHYLTDVAGIAEPQDGARQFYRRIKNAKIKPELITGSSHFASIKDRIDNFEAIEEIVAPGKAKVIVDFDKGIAGSKINAKYFLYKRIGDPLKKEPVTYYMLFLGYNDSRSEYYPATYVVEPSKKYVNGQIFFNCTIECLGPEVRAKSAKCLQLDRLKCPVMPRPRPWRRTWRQASGIWGDRYRVTRHSFRTVPRFSLRSGGVLP